MGKSDLDGCAGILVALGLMGTAIAVVFGKSIAEMLAAIFR